MIPVIRGTAAPSTLRATKTGSETTQRSPRGRRGRRALVLDVSSMASRAMDRPVALLTLGGSTITEPLLKMICQSRPRSRERSDAPRLQSLYQLRGWRSSTLRDPCGLDAELAARGRPLRHTGGAPSPSIRCWKLIGKAAPSDRPSSPTSPSRSWRPRTCRWCPRALRPPAMLTLRDFERLVARRLHPHPRILYGGEVPNGRALRRRPGARIG